MKKTSLVFILFSILGGIFAYQNFFLNKDIKTNDGLLPVKTEANAIYVADQKPGLFITINMINLNKNGYAVIYEDNQGGFGRIIGGTKLLPKGESMGISANLVRPVSDGETLFAVIHEDSGDGIFSPNLDTPLLDDEGNIVFTIFYTDQDVSNIENLKTKFDQPLKGCIVTGCSGQICSDEEVITTCEFLPEYSCYKTARCERQSDGQCCWTETAELKSCLN